MKKWIMTVFGVIAVSAFGAPLEENVAVERALAWMSGNPVMSKASQTVESVEAFPDNGTNYSVYVVRLEPTGYLILNSDDRLSMLVSFSADSSVDLSTDPQNGLRSMLIGYCENMEEELANWSSAPLAMRAMVESAAETELYGPFLETSWNQTAPYNLLCPAVSSGLSGYDNRAPAGCVPVAFAQILNFHRWPYYGTGSHSYVDNDGSTTGAHSADFSDVYDWGNMQAAHSSSDSQVSLDAVAELMYDLGVAAEAHYEADATSAITSLMGSRLGEFLYYESVNTHYSQSALIAPLKAELRAGFPCVVSYSDGTFGGHAFIADGLMVDGGITTYHFNLGWGGANNGWYTQNAIPGSFGTESLDGGITSLRPRLLAFPQTNAVSGETGGSTEVSWILPKRLEDEVQSLTVKRLVSGAWETYAKDTTLASRRTEVVASVWDDCDDFSVFEITTRYTPYAKDWEMVTAAGAEGGCFYKGGPDYIGDELRLTSYDSIAVDASTRLKLRAKYQLLSGEINDDVFRVLVSTDRSSFTEVWAGYGSMDWGDIPIDLSAYAGQSVYVRLQYDADGYIPGGGVWVDTVSVEQLTNPELEGQPIYYTTLTNLPAGTHTLAALLTDSDSVEHALGPAFSLTVSGSDDGDGMPEAWENQYGLDPAIDDGGLDSDGDGFSNWKEYICGTSPTNASSVWKLSMGAGSLPTFQGLDNRIYTIEYCDGLSSTNWKPIASGIVGSNGLFEVNSFESATNVCRFYRVKVQEAD